MLLKISGEGRLRLYTCLHVIYFMAGGSSVRSSEINSFHSIPLA